MLRPGDCVYRYLPSSHWQKGPGFETVFCVSVSLTDDPRTVRYVLMRTRVTSEEFLTWFDDDCIRAHDCFSTGNENVGWQAL